MRNPFAFTTPVPVGHASRPIAYGSTVGLLGSCFAEHMAEKFDYYQFKSWSNPYGILFQPTAIENVLHRAVAQQAFDENDIFLHDGHWHCFDAHARLSDADPQKLLQKLNAASETLRREIKSSTHLILTYGTAWVYRDKKSGDYVANCHKVPQVQFEKELLSVAAVTSSIAESIRLIGQINPTIQMIFTVSPVRHLKDGVVGNQRSKAHLIAALHEAIAQERHCSYFPGYEIVMDELRDYRFFASDMLHPSQTAIDYIWQRFVDSNLAPDASPVMGRVSKIRSGLAHRAFNPESAGHREFLADLHQSVLRLQQQFPHMRF